ncbi:MAG: hypothetical protein K2O81_03325 [Clostridia bacterium]|nr:hypothetical protein [Clostridia bacterium]
MNNSELKNVLNEIVGLRLTDVHPVCEMMVFSFERYSLHSQCLTRIIKNNDILVTTLDYQSWDGEITENNDEWFNLDKFKPEIEGGTVLSVKLSPLNDLVITMNNGIVIEVYIQNSHTHFDDEHEQYRFFEHSTDDETKGQKRLQPHYVVFNKNIEKQI